MLSSKSHPQTAAALAQRAAERHERYHVSVVPFLPAASQLQQDVPAILGVYSVTQAPNRWLSQPDTVDLCGLKQSPTEVSRDYLSFRFPRKLKRKLTQIEACQPVPAPRLAMPGRYFDMVYVDIRAAYWSLVYGLGWDVDYWPQKWLARGESHEDFPLPGNRPARNYLVSISIADGLVLYLGGKLIKQQGNRFINWPLYRLVHDVLNALALEAARLGAVYVNTDGYILPARRAESLMSSVGEWGLAARVKEEGPAIVRGVGNYDIGTHKSRHPRWEMPRFHDSLRYEDTSWLRKRVSALLRPLPHI